MVPRTLLKRPDDDYRLPDFIHSFRIVFFRLDKPLDYTAQLQPTYI
jgi:hypothetical protein